MTTLISWVSYSDTGESPHLPRAVYLASDSRITWGSAELRWEAGRKVFAPSTLPHLFGYCGDVVFPALILGQIVSAIDAGVLFAASTSADERHQRVAELVEQALSRGTMAPSMDFTIHHVMRERSWPQTAFRAWKIMYDSGKRTTKSAAMPLPSATEVIGSFGSGRGAAKLHRDRWEVSDSAGRSRAIMAAFCDAIGSGDDPLSGGSPQLAALYTQGAPRQIGVIFQGRRFMNGMELKANASLARAEWRDALGQVVDPVSLRAKQGARRFARPRKLGVSE